MIFVSVGMQMPFDRLCQAVDAWAGDNGRDDVFMQIGETDWRPSNVEYTELIDPSSFKARVRESTLLVMHAGIGSIVTAFECGKPVLVMPRREHLHETRNDHQFATARKLVGLNGVVVAMDEIELVKRLDEMSIEEVPMSISKTASPELIEKIHAFVHGSK